LNFLSKQEGTGRPGCHLSRLPESGLILTTSYSDGRLTGYPVRQGLPGPVIVDFQYNGSGPVSGRQDSAHAHQVMKSPHSEVLYVCDLGSDRIWMHRLDRLELPPVTALTVPGGYGPRHLAFDPVSPVAYVLCELVPRILVAEIDPDTALMRITGEADTVATDSMGTAAPAAAPAAVKVHPSGRTLAVSNRFDDTIAVFRIIRGSDTGGRDSVALHVGLELADRFDCRGKTPRDICFTADGSSLLIANQDSHAVTCRRFDHLSGRPLFQSPEKSPVESWGPVLETGSPVCVVMLD
jgi:6-phosphogluconolactonase